MYLTQKYMHIHAYTNIRPLHHSVGICKYHEVCSGNTCIYCCRQGNILLIGSHIFAHMHIRSQYVSALYRLLHVSMWYVLRRMPAVYACTYDSYTCIDISWYINVHAQKYMHILICRITDSNVRCPARPVPGPNRGFAHELWRATDQTQSQGRKALYRRARTTPVAGAGERSTRSLC